MGHCRWQRCPQNPEAKAIMTVLTSPSQKQYQLLQKLSCNSSGNTRLALDLQRSPPELCVVQPSWSQAPGRFYALVQGLQRLGEHRQMPALVDAFQINNQSYLVHEYIRGPSLAEVLVKQGPFTAGHVRRFLIDALGALQWLQRQQLVHGYLSLASWRYRDNASGSPLVLVNFRSTRHLECHALLDGHPAYVAPEQFHGRFSYASDVYSLGLTCLHLINGVETLGALQQDLPDLEDKRLTTVLAGMVESQETQRFNCATAVLAALGRRSPPPSCLPPQHKMRLPDHSPAQIIHFPRALNAG